MHSAEVNGQGFLVLGASALLKAKVHLSINKIYKNIYVKCHYRVGKTCVVYKYI